MPTLEVEQKFERYRINRWLGNGVSGESYEAEDTLQLRKVTLKLLHPWATLSDSARRQFFRDMQGIGRLNHPYLAAVLDYGEYDGKLYVARRYVSSGSLLSPEGRMWFKPPLPVEDAFHYAQQLAHALHYIHLQGYLHGSLTLANTLILRISNNEHDPEFAPFLLADVGLANFVRGLGQPRTSSLPLTAAPEQLEQVATAASDQFALAVLLYLWLAGRPPYFGSPAEIEQQKRTAMIVPLTVFNNAVTPAQEQTICRALSVYPEERYPSILAFTDTLMATLSPERCTPMMQVQDPIPQMAFPFEVPAEAARETELSLPTQHVEQNTTDTSVEVAPSPQAEPASGTLETISITEPLFTYEAETDALFSSQMAAAPAFQSQSPSEPAQSKPTPSPNPVPERPLEPLP